MSELNKKGHNIAKTHMANFCLGCGRQNDNAQDACPRCGSRRHRAYRKPGDIIS